MRIFARSIKRTEVLKRFKRSNAGIASKRINKLEMQACYSTGKSAASKGQKISLPSLSVIRWLSIHLGHFLYSFSYGKNTYYSRQDNQCSLMQYSNFHDIPKFILAIMKGIRELFLFSFFHPFKHHSVQNNILVHVINMDSFLLEYGDHNNEDVSRYSWSDFQASQQYISSLLLVY